MRKSVEKVVIQIEKKIISLHYSIQEHHTESKTSFLILEENTEMILGKTECKMLQNLIKIHMEIRDLEEKEIFLLGGKEMFFYMQDVGILKGK